MSNKYGKVNNYINGVFVGTITDRWMNVESPLTGEVIAEVAISSKDDLDKAVSAAKEAFKTWSKTPIKDRVQVFSDTRDFWNRTLMSYQL
jgi:malonate-semialdehyde dehydrogenase (acetylating)/methylmalonate-semialdehyde dehydrogenase